MLPRPQVCYGMFVESVMERIRDGISLDFLARLIVDVHQDSSRVTDSFISSYQATQSPGSIR